MIRKLERRLEVNDAKGGMREGGREREVRGGRRKRCRKE